MDRFLRLARTKESSVNDENNTAHANRDAQLAALLASATVIAGIVFYWVMQIQAVRESLAMAYG